jgi:hypothetical protein
MAAYSWLRVGRDYFLGCREDYLVALAAMYRDSELLTNSGRDGGDPVYNCLGHLHDTMSIEWCP